VSLPDDIIPIVIDEHITRECRLCVIGFHARAETSGCRFDVPITVVDTDHDGRLIFVYVHNDFSFEFDFQWAKFAR